MSCAYWAVLIGVGVAAIVLGASLLISSALHSPPPSEYDPVCFLDERNPDRGLWIVQDASTCSGEPDKQIHVDTEFGQTILNSCAGHEKQLRERFP